MVACSRGACARVREAAANHRSSCQAPTHSRDNYLPPANIAHGLLCTCTTSAAFPPSINGEGHPQTCADGLLATGNELQGHVHPPSQRHLVRFISIIPMHILIIRAWKLLGGRDAYDGRGGGAVLAARHQARGALPEQEVDASSYQEGARSLHRRMGDVGFDASATELSLQVCVRPPTKYLTLAAPVYCIVFVALPRGYSCCTVMPYVPCPRGFPLP